jgi:Holliday junction DNA helicase RuvB
LEFYTNEEIKKILARSAKILGVELTDDALEEISKRARFTPRTANYLLKRCRDYAQVHKLPLAKESVKASLALLEIDELGLLSSDRKIVETIITKFSGGPVGLKTIAAATGEEESTIEEVVEPYLIQLGLLERTTKRRLVTKRGYEHLGFDYEDTSN